MGPRKYEKNTEKNAKIVIFGPLLFFFRYFRGPTLGGGFCTFFVIFSDFGFQGGSPLHDRWVEKRGGRKASRRAPLPKRAEVFCYLQELFCLQLSFFAYSPLRPLLDFLVDVSDIFYFFRSGRGKGESEAPGGGIGFFLKIPGGGGVSPAQEGPRGREEFGRGGGGKVFFFGGEMSAKIGAFFAYS